MISMEDPKRQQPLRPPAQPSEPEKKEHEPDEKEGEKEEPEQVANVSMTMTQFTQLVRELRKPVFDERAESRKQRMREHNQKMMEDDRKIKINRFRACNHMQLPGSVLSGCCVIAWGNQSDGKRRGVCQHCGTVFSPERSECISDEVWKAYAMMVRLPTHPGGNVNTIFQSA